MEHFALGGKRLLSGFPSQFSGIAAIHAKRVQEDQSQTAGVRSSSSSSTAVVDAPSSLPTLGSQQDPGSRRSGREHDSLMAAFDPSSVEPWDPERFKFIKKLQNATRNHGQVVLMNDTRTDTLYAVKQMPNEWIKFSHQEFVQERPLETEQPWQDISCIGFLKASGFLYACDLIGVYRDATSTYVVTTFASEGDLFTWCEGGSPTGPVWEMAVLPVARQMMQAVQQLHDLGIVHRDLSLENIILSKGTSDLLHVRVIDFGMVSMLRQFQKCLRGKASYQAPEMHSDEVYDAYLSDAFAMGVTLYTVIMKDYPWLSTRPGGCKCCDYVRKYGFRPYLEKRKLRNSNTRVAHTISEPLKELLEGLLAFSPKDRLTLGEQTWTATGTPRRSVWDTAWMRVGCPPGPSGY